MKYKDKIINLFTDYCKENNKITIYDDYRDHENPYELLYCYNYKTKEKIRITSIDEFYDNILNAYSDAEIYYIDEFIKDFKSSLKDYRLKIYLDYHDDLLNDLKDILYDYVDIEFPIDNFLNDKIKVNIFYKSKTNSGYDDEWLPWLLHTQGFLCKDHPYLKKLLNCLHVYHSEKITKKDKELYNKDYKENIFLKSLIDEIENCYLDSPRDLCFIAEISIKDYFNLLEKNKEFFINKDAMVGLVDFYNGGGSLLDIQLQKDIKLNTNNIKILVEKIDKYTVDEIYGLIGSCFKDCVVIQ